MELLRNVEFSITAEKRIDDIVNYLENVFTEKVKFNFLEKLYISINAIKFDPKSFPISEYNITIRKCVVTKQTTIFYRFDSKKITIVSVFDSRQNPLKINSLVINYLNQLTFKFFKNFIPLHFIIPNKCLIAK